MIGTIVNCSTIIAGSITGSVLKRGIPESYHAIVMQAMGLAVTALGVNSIVEYLPKSRFHILFIVSLVIGGLIGEKLNLEQKFTTLVCKYSKGNLAEGLTTAILLFCIGTLSILGPIESALKGDNTYLFTNAILDGFTSIILASSFGIGITIAAVVLFLWQGFFYCMAGAAASFITPELLTEISIIGGLLILSSGLSILGIKKFSTMNFIPALLVPVIFIVIKSLI